jgi:hypothetical protein
MEADADAVWKKFIDSDWLSSRPGSFLSADKDNTEEVIPWLCTAFAMWYKCYIAII